MVDARLSDAIRVLELQQQLIEWQATEIVRLRMERDAALRTNHALATVQADVAHIKDRLTSLLVV